jgi:hypothetical protein
MSSRAAGKRLLRRTGILIGAAFGMLLMSAPAEEPSPGVIKIGSPAGAVAAAADVSEVESRLYLAVEKQARYLLTKVHPWATDPSLKLVTESKSEEHWIRPNAGTILGFALLRRFGPYDESVIGIGKDPLLDGAILPMMRYLTTVHLTEVPWW